MHRLDWFVDFLSKLKAVVRLFRRPLYKESMANLLVSNGLFLEAKAIAKFRAAFAKWRWSTLGISSKAAASILGFIIRLWPILHAKLFKKPGEAELVSKVSEAFADKKLPFKARL